MLKRVLIFVHRWLGVALCLIFLLWFPSGIGMMYWDYPSVSRGDRLERSAALDASTIKLSPAEAAAVLGGDEPAQARLNTFDGRPVYRFGSGGRDGGAVASIVSGPATSEREPCGNSVASVDGAGCVRCAVSRPCCAR